MSIVCLSLSVFPFGQDELGELLLEHSKSLFWLKVKIRLGCKGKKNLLNSHIVRNSAGEKHQMLTFISSIDQLLSNIDQSFIFLFI